MFSKFKSYFEKNTVLILFGLTLFLFYSLSFIYNFCLNSNVYDFLFESDSPRVFGDMILVYGNHYRFYVHPLFIIFVQPISLLIDGIIHNNLLTIIILQSLIAGLQSILIYDTINKFNKSKLICFFVSILYVISFSSIVFNSGIELYNFAALGLIFTWNIVSRILTNKMNHNSNITILLILAGMLCLGITVTNYVIFLIACFILILSKKVSFKKIFLINVLIFFISSLLIAFEIFAWKIPVEKDLLSEETNAVYVDKKINLFKIKNVIKDDYFNTIVSSKIYDYTYYSPSMVSKHQLKFDGVSSISKVICTIFFSIILVSLCINLKKNLLYNLGLVLALIFNTLFHVIYGNDICYLYSLHFLYLFMLLFGVNLEFNNYKLMRLFKFIIIILCVCILINNIINFNNILNIAKDIYGLSKFGTFSKLSILLFIIISFLVIFSLINLFIYFLKKKEIKYFIFSFFVFIIISTLFVAFDIFVNKYEFVKKSATFDEISYSVFKDEFTKDVESYNDYVKEYNSVINDVNAKLVDVGNNDFYLFGFGNRKKILYKDGKLIDLFNNKVLYSFDITDYLIIPNEFTVLIKSNNKFYKIYENSTGVYINDKIISGTNVDIVLYDFNDYKYGKVLNTLYGEILFNIKDSAFIPNIMVYDSPWYRDGAMGAMVLKKTNNLKLIEKWINSIDRIYDGQNGNNEPDNLGELLYLNSFVNNNDKIISKIIKEADSLAKSNPDGNYIYGLVDGGIKNTYASSWLKFGLEANGLTYKYSYDYDIDDYANLLWFSNECNNYNDLMTFGAPYLDWAKKHCYNKHKVYMNSGLYPLSWESDASKAKYNNINDNLSEFKEKNISPTHVWAAAEMFLYLYSL